MIRTIAEETANVDAYWNAVRLRRQSLLYHMMHECDGWYGSSEDVVYQHAVWDTPEVSLEDAFYNTDTDYRADTGFIDPSFHLAVFHHNAEQAINTSTMDPAADAGAQAFDDYVLDDSAYNDSAYNDSAYNDSAYNDSMHNDSVHDNIDYQAQYQSPPHSSKPTLGPAAVDAPASTDVGGSTDPVQGATPANTSNSTSRVKPRRPGISKNGKQLRLMPDGTYEDFPPLLTDVLDAAALDRARRYRGNYNTMPTSPPLDGGAYVADYWIKNSNSRRDKLSREEGRDMDAIANNGQLHEYIKLHCKGYVERRVKKDQNREDPGRGRGRGGRGGGRGRGRGRGRGQ